SLSVGHTDVTLQSVRYVVIEWVGIYSTPCELSGTINYIENEFVPRRLLAHRPNRKRGMCGFARTVPAGDPITGGGDQVSQHRSRCRRTTGTLSVEHELAGCVGLHVHGVERPTDPG